MAGQSVRRGMVALVTAATLLLSSIPATTFAALVSTDEIIAASAARGDRARVAAFLAREDVQAQMRALGVSPDEAHARVAALSDAEVSRIAGHIDTMPAGGDALGVIIGAAVLVFIVLLITDIAGLTKVFPWTRSVRE
mgnify:CR=1 FL=1